MTTTRPHVTHQPVRRTPMPDAASTRRRVFRLLHSTGDFLIADRAEAIARLLTLPGAKLFVLTP